MLFGCSMCDVLVNSVLVQVYGEIWIMLMQMIVLSVVIGYGVLCMLNVSGLVMFVRFVCVIYVVIECCVCVLGLFGCQCKFGNVCVK